MITSDPEALKSTFGELFSVDVSLPALNNTTDQVRLYTNAGALVDSLEYTPEWGGVDVALERRSLNVSATFQANWGIRQMLKVELRVSKTKSSKTPRHPN